MPDLQVDKVATNADLMAFIALPWQVYRADPYWVPPPISERREFYDRQKNPFFQHSRAEYFLARRGKRVVGTIAAIVNENHNRFHDERVGFFGVFEVMDDPEAAAALLQTAEAWVREQAMTAIRGPANFSSNDEWGMLIEGFDSAPVVLMTYNPPRYLEYMTRAGYVKAMDLFAYNIPRAKLVGGALPPKLLRVVEKVRQRYHIVVRPIDMKKFDNEVEKVKEVYNAAWERNWGFVPMTDAEVERLARGLRQFIDPALITMAEVDGRTVGVSLVLPDLNEPLRLAYPNPWTPEPITMARLMWHWKVRRQVSCVRMFALGLLPDFRNRGIDSLLYLEAVRAGVPQGYQRLELSWILETNLETNQAAKFMGGEVYKKYRIWEKAV